VDVLLGQIHVVVVGFAEHRDLSLQPIVLQSQLFSVLAGLLGHEVENHLGDLAHL